MSVRFCECGTLLKEHADDILVYRCVSCRKEYDPTSKDTLLFEELKSTVITNYDTLIHSATQDRLNPIKKAICIKCKAEKWINYMLLGASMTVIYTCLDCKTQWRP